MATEGIDRGGLQYGIDVDFNPADIRLFIKEIEEAQAAFAAFKAEVGSVTSSSASLKRDLIAVADAAKKAATSTEAGAKSVEGLTKEQIRLAATEARVKRELEAQTLIIERNAFVLKNKVELQVKSIATTRAEIAADNQLLQAGQRARAQIIANNVAHQTAIQFSQKTAGALLDEAAASNALTAALRKQGVVAALANAGLKPTTKGPLQGPSFQPDRPFNQTLDVSTAAFDKAQKERAEILKRRADNEDQIRAGILGNVKRSNVALLSEEQRTQKAMLDAQKAVAAAKQQLLTGKEIERLRALDPVLRQVDEASKNAARGTKSLEAEMRKSDESANRIGFTFRRLFGILAAFTLARRGIQGFFGLIKEGIDFNSTIETSQRSISGLLVAVADVRDEFGNLVTSGVAFQKVAQVSSSQLAILRTEALKSKVEFKELVDAFQQAIGPGFAAGLDVDQIRKFTVSISQTAAQLGLARGQLNEEIRALLSGNISKKNTRIATALGITPQDIQLAKQTGTLADFLQGKLRAFAVATEQSATDFDILFSNLKENLKQVIGTGAIGFFQELKGLVIDIKNSLSGVTPSGLIAPDPQAVKIVEGIAAGLRRAVVSAREFARSFTFDQLQSSAKLLGDLLGTAGEGLVLGLKGAVDGLKDAASIVSFIVNTVKSIGKGINLFLPTGLELADILQLLIEIRVATIAWSIASGTVLNIFTGLGNGLVLVGTLIRKLQLAFLGISLATPLSSLAGVDASLAKAVSRVALLRLGLVGVGIAAATFAASTLISEEKTKDIADHAKSFVAELSARTVEFFGIKPIEIRINPETLARAEAEVERLQAVVDGGNKNAKRDLEDAIAIAKNFREALIEKGTITTELGTGAFDRIFKSIKDFRKDIDQAVSGGDQQGFEKRLAAVRSQRQLTDFKENQTQAQTLVDIFNTLPPVIARANAGLTGEGKILKESQDEARKLGNELNFTKIFAGASEGIRQQFKTVNDAQFSLSEKVRELTSDSVANEARRVKIAQERQQIESDTSGLDAKQIAGRRVLLDLGQQLLEAKKKEAALEAAFNNSRDKQEARIAKGEIGARADGREERQAISAQIQVARKAVKEIQDKLNLQEVAFSPLQIAGSEDAKVLEGIKRQVRELLALMQEELSLGIEQTANDKTRQEIVDEVTKAINAQVQAEISLLNVQQKRVVEQKQNEAISARRLANAAKTENALAIQRAEQENQLSLLVLQKKQIDDQFASDRALLFSQIKRTDNTQLQLQKYEQIKLLIAGHTAETEKLNAEMEITNQQLDRTKREQSGGFFEGFAQGLKDFANQAQTVFQSAVELAKGAVEQAAQLAGQLVVDALDPNNKTTLRQRLATFFRQLGQQFTVEGFKQLAASVIGTTTPLVAGATATSTAAGLLQEAAFAWSIVADQILLAAETLAAGAGTSATGSFLSTISVAGSHAGGYIAKAPRVSSPSRFHAQAKGFIGGGRPAGIHPSDTIPAWLDPREFVISPRGTSIYSSAFLQAVNEGRFDPNIAAMFSGSRRASRQARRVASFSDGGSVATASGSSFAGGSSSSGGGVTLALTVASERDAERRLAGGRGSQLRFFQENVPELRSMLGIR